MATQKHRLPQGVKPLKYKLQITPNLGDFSYEGEEQIKIVITKPTKSLTLHALDLTIVKAVWIDTSKLQITPQVSFNKELETVTFKFSRPISGNGVLDIHFKGVILEGLQGFYKSRYLHNKQEKYLATTQLESTDARRFFPCFDEPSHKAVFEISTIIPKQLQVISNTIESKVLPHHNPLLKIVHFEATPKMSTYLLALIIGELEHSQTVSKRGVKIRIHTTHGKKSQTKFALNVTKKALDFLEEYFGIAYPLPVLDLIAIPDFAAGAMENWGAITFRETLLLVDEQHTNFTARQQVAEVIAHELVHQWFGNLVTMEWWTHLWLNESFATYMAYLTIDEIFPEWNYWTKFVLQEQSIALVKDSLKTSQPVEVEVKFPSEISESFDPAIVYAKGASLLRMLSSYIGPEDFRRGLAYYLKKHSYKNTSSVHLWEAFEKVAKKPVRQFMKKWTQFTGYPVIDVAVKGDNLLVSQQRFTLLPLSKPEIKQQPTWTVPLSPLIQGQSTDINSPELILTKTEQVFKLAPSTLVRKLNQEEQNYYIVNYHQSLFSQLLLDLKNQQLSSSERLAIIRNSFLLAKSGRIPTDAFLQIIAFLENETSYIVWSEVASSLVQISKITFGSKAEGLLEKFIAQLFGKLLQQKQLGYRPKKAESNNNQTLRALALLESGINGYQLSVKFARKQFRSKLAGKSLDANLRSAIYTIVAKYSSLADFKNLIKLYKQSNLAQEKQQILMALSMVQNPQVQEAVLKFIFSADVRDQDRHFALRYCLSNPRLKLKAWSVIKNNWSVLQAKYESSKMLGTIINGAGSFCTASELFNFEKFINKVKPKSAKQAVKQTREKIQINIAWRNRDLGLISKFLARQK